MTLTAVLCYGLSLKSPRLASKSFNRQPLKRHLSSLNVTHSCKSPTFRIRSFQHEQSKNNGTPEEQNKVDAEVLADENEGATNEGNAFITKLAIALGVAATVTIISFGLKGATFGSLLGIERLAGSTSSSAMAATPVGFTFKAFGYRFVLPEQAPGWVYFWLLMAAGCGLFVSEEALNIWVGISLARMLSLDGTWQSFVESFSRNSPYIISTVLWVYWGVCISDMIPFYLGKLFRQSGASDDVCSRVGIGEEKVSSITSVVQKYGNLSGFVERFSLGVRNPTAFLAGALGISPECFFAGVCFGGLITLPLQLGIGFLLRERPVFAVATVATVVGIWNVFPYALAALTALFLYLRRRHSS
ncbi:SNARE_assoc domain-containing protein [Cephalotus follicularis]|uniref:SNARE_assoc domain-containing protein n=1 Tax=Cephalotus follicularis TaxID=3775 RepID=A0A1Q3BSE0_CEPFO|nr:SNARE_assoc domain-containing protein [Cephalotus follicularis]